MVLAVVLHRHQDVFPPHVEVVARESIRTRHGNLRLWARKFVVQQQQSNSGFLRGLCSGVDQFENLVQTSDASMPRVPSRQLLHVLVLEVRGGRQCVQTGDRLADAATESQVERGALDRRKRHPATGDRFVVGQCNIAGDNAGCTTMIREDQLDRHVDIDPLGSV